MIFDHLSEVASRERLLSNEGYGPAKINYTIVINAEGKFLGFKPESITVTRGKKTKSEPRQYDMPSPEGKRTSGDVPNFLYDKSEYVLGSGGDDAARMANRKRLFRELVDEALGATGDAGILAVRRFLTRLDDGEFEVQLPVDSGAGAVYAFQDIEDPTRRVSDRPAVVAWWRARRARGGTEPGECIVCGRAGAIVKIHPAIANVPNGNTAGVALVSFNAPAFTSYGFGGDRSHWNAPFCRACADGYTRALNRLLAPAFPDPARPGETLAPGNYRLSPDTVAVFWASDPQFSAILGIALGGDPAAVAQLLHAPHAGVLRQIRAERFYSLIISGAQGRAVLRSSFDLTVVQVLDNLERYFKDISLVPMFPSERETLPLFVLIGSLQAPGMKSIVPSLRAQELYEAAVMGRPFPRTLLDSALKRLRAGEDFTRPRIAVIKAVLNRTHQNDASWKEITMSLDPDNVEPGYRLGRLFAVLEKLQADAINSPNATIVDRYFGAACATPAVVFPRLMKMAQHHASKSQRGDWYQRQIQEIVGGLGAADAFPRTLKLHQQGLFSVGYYHQRADLYTSKKTEAALEQSPLPAPSTEH